MTDDMTTQAVSGCDDTMLSKPIVGDVVLGPLALIQQAIDKGVDADQLDKLMDLQERWEHGNAKRDFMKAFSDCQGELPRVVRNKENKHTRSRYADLETVNSQVLPVITKHGFSLSFGEEDIPNPVENMCRMGATLRHRGGHSEHYHVDLPTDGSGIKGSSNMTPIHGKGSWSTYAQRYLTCMIFSVTIADYDNDGNNGGEAMLTEEQVFMLRNLMEQCEKAGAPVHLRRFLTAMKVPEGGVLEDILQTQFDQAKAGLKAKLADALKG